MKGKRKNRGWVWIARDADTASSYFIYHTARRPKLKVKTYTNGDGTITYNPEYPRPYLRMCQYGFERLFAFRIPPGGCQKVRVVLSAMWRGRARLAR